MRQSSASVKILVVEDEPSIAELIALNLEHGGYRVTCALNAQEAQRAIQVDRPDLVLLDWMLPGQSGESLLRRWRSQAETAAMPVIMLTALGTEENKVAGFDAGADDYLTKPFSSKELLVRIKALLRRAGVERAPEVWRLGSLVVDAALYEVRVDGTALKLGPKEFKLLSYMIQNVDRVHTREQLLSQVWDDRGHIEDRTVDVHIKRLREALGYAAFMVQTVRGVGYKLSATPPAV